MVSSSLLIMIFSYYRHQSYNIYIDRRYQISNMRNISIPVHRTIRTLRHSPQTRKVLRNDIQPTQQIDQPRKFIHDQQSDTRSPVRVAIVHKAAGFLSARLQVPLDAVDGLHAEEARELRRRRAVFAAASTGGRGADFCALPVALRRLAVAAKDPREAWADGRDLQWHREPRGDDGAELDGGGDAPEGQLHVGRQVEVPAGHQDGGVRDVEEEEGWQALERRLGPVVVCDALDRAGFRVQDQPGHLHRCAQQVHAVLPVDVPGPFAAAVDEFEGSAGVFFEVGGGVDVGVLEHFEDGDAQVDVFGYFDVHGLVVPAVEGADGG